MRASFSLAGSPRIVGRQASEQIFERHDPRRSPEQRVHHGALEHVLREVEEERQCGKRPIARAESIELGREARAMRRERGARTRRAPGTVPRATAADRRRQSPWDPGSVRSGALRRRDRDRARGRRRLRAARTRASASSSKRAASDSPRRCRRASAGSSSRTSPRSRTADGRRGPRRVRSRCSPDAGRRIACIRSSSAS